MPEDQTAPTAVKTSAKGHRLWIPFTIGGLALAAITYLRLQPDLEQNMKAFSTTAVVLLTTILELLWFLLASRFSWKSRLGTLAVLALVVFGVKNTVRVDGTVNGTGLPKLAWRWTTRPAPRLAEVASVPPALTNSVSGMASVQIPNVPQFFGPNRDGVIRNARLGRDWNANPPRQVWCQPVGAGWSAFAVVDGHAFTQEQRGEAECVTCYDVLTGRLLWAHTNAVHFTQWQGGEGPRGTPSVQQGQVIAIGATGILDCLDAATGQRVWSHDVLAENAMPNLIWGVSVSPLVFEDTVVVTGGFTSGPTVLAYRRTDGKPLWHAGTDKASYASPILTTLAGRRVVLSNNAASLTAHDPTTGEILLNFHWTDDKWPKASQPVVLESNRVFLSAGYGYGCVMLEVKAGADGKLVATQLWKNMRMKTQFNSVAVRDGFFYGIDDGLLACVETATGERKWKDGRYGSGQTLLVDDLIIVQSEPGQVVLVEAKPDGFKELGRIPALSSKTWNHPTLAGRYLLVRNDKEMACYELPLQNKQLSARNN